MKRTTFLKMASSQLVEMEEETLLESDKCHNFALRFMEEMKERHRHRQDLTMPVKIEDLVYLCKFSYFNELRKTFS